MDDTFEYDKTYLGDGLYVSHSHGQIKLACIREFNEDRPDGKDVRHWVYLEPEVLTAFIKHQRRRRILDGERCDQLAVRFAFAAIEAEFAHAALHLASEGVPAGPLGARQIVKVAMPDDPGGALLPEGPVSAPRNHGQRRKHDQHDRIKEAKENDVALVQSEAVIPWKHR